VICAGGVGDPATFARMMALGSDGVQMGTRFIATTECTAHPDYKAAIVHATPADVVLTERLTGVPVAVIQNDYVRRIGTSAGPIARAMLRHRRLKKVMRSIYALTSMRRLARASMSSAGAREYWQAGKSVGGITDIVPAGQVVRQFAAAAGMTQGETPAHT
jgi:nitronate monooxygenase